MHTLNVGSITVHYNGDWSGNVLLYPGHGSQPTEVNGQSLRLLAKTIVKIETAKDDEVGRPTIEQTAWVFEKLADNLDHPGSFRKVIYDRMGYGPEAYSPLFLSGGMSLTNAALEWQDWQSLQRMALHHHGISLDEEQDGGWSIKTGDGKAMARGDTIEGVVDNFHRLVIKVLHPDWCEDDAAPRPVHDAVKLIMSLPEDRRIELWSACGGSVEKFLLSAEREVEHAARLAEQP